MFNEPPSFEYRRKLFYAEALAGLYDHTIDLVVPNYKLLHKTMFQLIRDYFEHHRLFTTGGTMAILDLGSGTGAEALPILAEFPGSYVVAVDLCRPMHLEFRRNFSLLFGGEKDFDSFCTTITADILSPEASPESVLSFLPKPNRVGRFQSVITDFAMHHLAPDEKEEAYRRAFTCLDPGGLLVNGDLFSYTSQDLSRQAHEFDIQWIENSFSCPPPEFQETPSLSKERREDLRRRWVEHYHTHNILEPLESSESIKGRMESLRSLGFSEVGCPYRFWQTAILWARK